MEAAIGLFYGRNRIYITPKNRKKETAGARTGRFGRIGRRKQRPEVPIIG